MTVQIESLSTLERRVNMSVPMADVEREVGARLKRLARTVRMPGFRPGKVPLRIVAQQYEPQVRGEVVSDAVQKAFTEAVQGQNLRVAGTPRFEPSQVPAADTLQVSATFEVYPDVTPGDIATVRVERPAVSVGEAEVDRTIESIRRQRATFREVARGAQPADRVTMDFRGTLEGVEFAGGTASDAVVTLGAGRLLPDFEAGVAGTEAGQQRSFEVRFPDDYGSAEVAGKIARFEVTVKKVEEPVLPPVDADLAKALGVADGDLARMRQEIRENVEREVKQRVFSLTRQRVMQALLDGTAVELPRSLVEAEIGRMVEGMRENLKARGVKDENLPLDPELFREQASRRVKLGLIVAEYIRRHGLAAKPEQVRKLVENSARTYEHPFEVIKWVYSQPDRLAEFEGMAVEENVVAWVLEHARTEEVAMAFDDLMGAGAAG